MPPQRLPCPDANCDKTFTAPHNVRRHHRTVHEGLRDYACDRCDQTFQTRQNLDRHCLTHEEVKPFTCGECTFSSTTQQNLDAHNNLHLGVKPYKCDFLVEGNPCGKSFTQAPHLTAHQRGVHTGCKPFVCEECGFATTQSSHLKTHQLRHSGEKPHVCPVCVNEGFTTTGALKLHIRYHHTNEKPYICSEDNCGRSFAASGALLQHIRAHFPVLDHICPDKNCGSAYRLAASLAYHIQANHTPEGIQRKKRQEAKILDLLQAHNIPFKAQHTIDFKCLGGIRDATRCHIDFIVEVRDTSGKLVGFIFLEVDEHQHTTYSIQCETRRMADVYESLTVEGNTYPLAFLRYNPDAFKVDGKTRMVASLVRRARLVHMLKNWNFQQPFSILYMYYDTVEDSPQIFTDPAYNEAFKAACVGCIVD